MADLKYYFRQIKKFPTWIYWLPAQLYKLFFFLFLRSEIKLPEGMKLEDYRGMIGSTWHNRLLFFPALFPDSLRRRTRAVVSASRDGQYLVDFLKMFHVECVRGSSAKKGVNAELSAMHSIRAGINVVFTPDGPRGPAYKIKRGPVHLASITGAPLVVVAINYSRYWSLKSWDKFQIPKPFAKVTLSLSEPMPVPPNLTADELEHYRQVYEKKMLEYTIDHE